MQTFCLLPGELLIITIGNFKGQCHVKTWLCQIAKISYFSYLRKNKKIIQLDLEQPKHDSFSENSIEETYEYKEIICKMFKIISTFNESVQNVMIYRIYFEMPYSEISKLLKISESSAKVIYHRGMLVLKSMLRERYGYEI